MFYFFPIRWVFRKLPWKELDNIGHIMCYKISTIVGIDASYSSRKFEKKLLNHGLLESEKPKCPGDYDHEWTGIHPKFLIEKILYLSFVYILETQHVALSHNKTSHSFFFV